MEHFDEAHLGPEPRDEEFDERMRRLSVATAARLAPRLKLAERLARIVPGEPPAEDSQ